MNIKLVEEDSIISIQSFRDTLLLLNTYLLIKCLDFTYFDNTYYVELLYKKIILQQFENLIKHIYNICLYHIQFHRQ